MTRAPIPQAAFLRPDPAAFEVDGRLLPWGTTLAQFIAGLDLDPSADPPRAPCAQAYGFPAISAEPGMGSPHRPVRGLTYQLAPYDPGRERADERWWVDAIRAVLGPPGDEHIAEGEERANAGEGDVIYHATWPGPIEVGLSVFGAQRQEPYGMAAAYLYVSWTDDEAAARAFLPAIQARQAVLDRLLPEHWEAHSLEREQPRCQAQDAGADRRELDRALADDPVFDTPLAWSARLGERQVACWAARDGTWGVSTRRDTVLFEVAQQVAVAWQNLRPKRFGGEMTLDLGGLRLADGPGSESLTAVARFAGGRLGRDLPCTESDDIG